MENPVDMIFVLPAGIKQNASGRWVSTDLSVEDNEKGAPGGTLRIQAAAILAQFYPKAIVMTGGGKGYDVSKWADGSRPLLAEILYDELVEAGIAVDRIILERTSQSTYQGLQEIDRVVRESQIKRLLIVTNRYHCERVRAMLEVKFSHLSSLVIIECIAAEDILIAHDKGKWEKLIENSYQSVFMKKRITLEKEGVAQIYKGTYLFR